MALDWLDGLPQGMADVVAGQCEERAFSKGDIVHVEGDPASAMWFVNSGRVHAVKTLPNGFELTVCRVNSGSLFGLCCGCETKAYACRAVAATDVSVSKMPAHVFRNLLSRYPAITAKFLGVLSGRLQYAQQMRSLNLEPVEKRVANLLVTLEGEFGSILPYTRREIAEMVGTTVETSIRVLSKFQKKGMVRSVRGSIILVKSPDLQRLAQG